MEQKSAWLGLMAPPIEQALHAIRSVRNDSPTARANPRWRQHAIRSRIDADHDGFGSCCAGWQHC